MHIAHRNRWAMTVHILLFLQNLIGEYGRIDKVSRIDLQSVGNVVEDFQRKAMCNSWSFNTAEQRTANSCFLSQFFL